MKIEMQPPDACRPNSCIRTDWAYLRWNHTNITTLTCRMLDNPRALSVGKKDRQPHLAVVVRLLLSPCLRTVSLIAQLPSR
jgi:hypothetical protein